MLSSIGLVVLVIAGLLFIGFSFMVRQGLKPDLRPLSGYDALFSHVGQAVESGGRVHMSLGPNGIVDTETGVTLAGLEMFKIIAETSSISDNAPVASTSDALSFYVISDTVRRAYSKHETIEKYDPTASRLVAFDPVALAAGTTSIIADDNIQANIMMGAYGPELALMIEAGQRQRIPQIAASSRIEGQAVGYVMSEHNLIGEEIFASNAYISKRAPAIGSLLMQDILRWLVIGAIIVGAVFRTVGLI